MNKFLKTFSVFLVAAIISIIATLGTYKYLEYSSKGQIVDNYNYGSSFGQDRNLTLTSYNEDAYPNFTDAAEKALHAVVHIKSTVKPAQQDSRQQMQSNPLFEYFFGPGQGGKNYQQLPRIGSGSGVIISADGYIITNNHVIDNATELDVTLNDNRKFSAKVIGTDPNTDIALIKIEGDDFPFIPFGDSDALKVGEWVIAVGNPFNLTSTVTKGIVSAKARGNIGGRNRESIQSFIQTDAAINPGNSGGALVNTRGELVGINTAIYSETGNFAGYGFAVPITIAGKVVADIKEYGAVQRAMLGASIMDINVAREIDPNLARDQSERKELSSIKEKIDRITLNEGVFIGGFADKSPAKQAGIEEGDIVTAINGVKTPSSSMLQEQVSRFRPGDKISVDVDRYGKKMSFDVILKNIEGTTSIVKKTDGMSVIGAVFKDLTDEKRNSIGLKYGVEVAGVDKGGAFAKAGINKGFIIQEINNSVVNSANEVEQLITRISNSEDKVLFIKGISSVGKTEYKLVELVSE